MPAVINSIHIDGRPEAIFDLVTTARFWPQWHPATLAVAGVTQRPFGLGDRIHERVRFGDLVMQGTWEVVEYARPWRAVLRTEMPFVQITYSFAADGGGTDFRRELEYEASLAGAFPDPGAFDRLMQSQSGQGLRKLKELVEEILREEADGLP
jgi:uncharacterized protein YndB with AHSA1/START domain